MLCGEIKCSEVRSYQTTTTLTGLISWLYIWKIFSRRDCPQKCTNQDNFKIFGFQESRCREVFSNDVLIGYLAVLPEKKNTVQSSRSRTELTLPYAHHPSSCRGVVLAKYQVRQFLFVIVALQCWITVKRKRAI